MHSQQLLWVCDAEGRTMAEHRDGGFVCVLCCVAVLRVLSDIDCDDDGVCAAGVVTKTGAEIIKDAKELVSSLCFCAYGRGPIILCLVATILHDLPLLFFVFRTVFNPFSFPLHSNMLAVVDVVGVCDVVGGGYRSGARTRY